MTKEQASEIQQVADLNLKIQTLFKTTKQYLKKHHLNNLPWVLLIGDQGSGKTQLILQSELDPRSTLQRANHSDQPTDLIDWWVTDEAVFVDLAGHLALPELDSTEDVLWQQCLRQFKQAYRKRPIKHIILTVDFPHLYRNNGGNYFSSLTQRINRQLQSLLKINKQCTVTLVITQCDRMSGFNEFFADLSEDDRHNALGFTLNQAHSRKPLGEDITEKCNDLISRIGERLIWRLHHEQSIVKRNQLKDFPVQLEQLFVRFDRFCNQLIWADNIQLAGIYLTSSLQKAEPIALLDANMTQSLHMVRVTRYRSVIKQQPYFIKHLLQTISRQAQAPIPLSPGTMWCRWLTMLGAGIVLSGVIFLFHHGYQAHLKAIDIIQTHLEKPKKTLKIPGSLPWLSTLKNLNTTQRDLKNMHLGQYHWLGFMQGRQLQQELNKAYQHVLRHQLKPYLRRELVNTIETNLAHKRLAVYHALKTYLMLGNAKHYDAQAVTQWFQLYWQKHFRSQTQLQQLLVTQLKNYLALPNRTWSLDQQLVSNAQLNLKQLTPPQLAFLEIQSNYPAQNVKLLNKYNSTSGIQIKHLTIPVFYSPKYFTEVYDQQIPNIPSLLHHGNWVIGTLKGITLNTALKQRIVIEVQKLYLSQYTQQWRTIIPNISLIPPKTLSDAMSRIDLVTQNKSQLMRLLGLVLGNANLANIAGTATPQDPTLKALIAWRNKSVQYHPVIKALMELKRYLFSISNATAPLYASFQATTARFKSNGKDDPITKVLTLAKTLPQPLKNWLDTIALSSFQILLQNSRNYIDAIWNNTVIPEYNNNISQGFPIFPHSDQPISHDAFTHFFAPNGSINLFFNNLLSPFVNTSKNYWTWNKLDGLTLGIPQKTLNMLLRASLVQEMFYSLDHRKPSFNFSIQATTISKNVARAVININGQILNVTPNAQSKQLFLWPNPASDRASITLISTSGKRLTISAKGPWALFKLLQRGRLKTTTSAKDFKYTFVEGDMLLTIDISAKQLINPFIPGILGRFRAPENL